MYSVYNISITIVIAGATYTFDRCHVININRHACIQYNDISNIHCKTAETNNVKIVYVYLFR